MGLFKTEDTTSDGRWFRIERSNGMAKPMSITLESGKIVERKELAPENVIESTQKMLLIEATKDFREWSNK